LDLLQQLFIFGFPFGESLGKEITASSTTISSIRNNQIQVNGGMNPGNSGGPVVDVKGNVVGVAVAGIKDTNINFAIPADAVYDLISREKLR
jgi:S1-C subfamily serine protease